MSIVRFWWGIFTLAFLRLHFGGDSSSASSNTTNNYDKRVAVQDGFGLSGDSNFASITTITNVTDGGIVKNALEFSSDTVSRALDSVDTNAEILGKGYMDLIGAADSLFDRGESLIGRTQQAVADAYNQAQVNATGTLDNRTVIILAAVAVAALFALRK